MERGTYQSVYSGVKVNEEDFFNVNDIVYSYSKCRLQCKKYSPTGDGKRCGT